MAKIDGRPYKIDVYANPALDGPGISITGFPSTYLDGSSVTAPVYVRGTTTAAGASWTVTVAATSITMSMPAADVALIGEGRYSWSLIPVLASGAKTPIIGGSLFVSRDNKPSTSSTSVTFASDPIETDITITQVLSDAVSVIDGGVPAAVGAESVDGGAP